jgi:HD-like signal output (HDOD) protein/CheY-like chemotaxis protein
MATARILIIERNQKIGELVAGQLREKGFEAVDVRHGAEAVLQLRQKLCDLIMLDNQVTMGGVKTARILRLHKKYNAIPIVLGLPSNKEDARAVIGEAQKVGLKNFLLKPFTLSQLQKKITAVIENDDGSEKPSDLNIREEIRSLTNLPAMPAAQSKLLTLLSKADEEVDLNQVAHTLEQDPALSARVMKTCRSAYFGFQGSLMKQAVAFLGVATIRKIVQSAVIYEMFAEEKSEEGQNMSMQDLWRHSLATGMAMEIIGKEDKKKTHFILGVMHDIGKAVFKVRFTEHFSRVLELVEKENLSVLKAEEEILGITHADCGAELAVHWDLPAEVRTAIAAHHNPGSSMQHKRLAAMVHIADIAVRTMKIGFAGDHLIPEMDPYAKRLKKGIEEITEHREDFVSQINSILGGGGEEGG